MPKYTAHLSVYATARFELETDKPIPKKKLVEKFLNSAECVASLCHQCSNGIELDFEIVAEVFDELTTDQIFEK